MELVDCQDIPRKEDVEKLFKEDADVVRMYNNFIKMKKLCEETKGVGLSAVQVGLPLSMFVAKLDAGWRNFLNCEYERAPDAKEIKSLEGCLSLPGRGFRVSRHDRIVVRGQDMIVDADILVRDIEEELTGFDAIVVQHEIDHQNGILISDIGTEVDT